MLALVGGADEWAWANNQALLGPLQDSMAKVEAWKKSNDFWKRWTVAENLGAAFRKLGLSTEMVISEVAAAEHAETGLRALLQRVEKETLVLKRMQQTRADT